MRRSIVVIVVVVVVVVLVSSLLLVVEASGKPHAGFISESTAEEISGQNYTLASLMVSTGSGLPYAFYGNKLAQEAIYSNTTQVNSNGTPVNYFFQVYVLEFNTTKMAQRVFYLEANNLEYGGVGVVHSVQNGTYKGFHYTYTTESQIRYGSEYFWGTVGYLGDLVFMIRGQSPLPPKIGMSTVAIDQIDAMTSFHF